MVAQFKFHQLVDKADKQNLPFITQNDLPALEEQDEHSKYVSFIIKGKVHIMDKTGLYEFGVLETGSYFGDISTITGMPNAYSYLYNPYGKKSLNLLSIKAQDFKKLLERYSLAREIFNQAALDRVEVFDAYKRMTLIRYMKHIVKNPYLVNKNKFANKKLPILNRLTLFNEVNVKTKLVNCLLENYKLSVYLANHKKKEAKAAAKTEKEQKNGTSGAEKTKDKEETSKKKGLLKSISTPFINVINKVSLATSTLGTIQEDKNEHLRKRTSEPLTKFLGKISPMKQQNAEITECPEEVTTKNSPHKPVVLNSPKKISSCQTTDQVPITTEIKPFPKLTDHNNLEIKS